RVSIGRSGGPATSPGSPAAAWILRGFARLLQFCQSSGTAPPTRCKAGQIAAASLAITDMIQVSAKQDIRVLELGIRSVDYADHVSRELFGDHLECVVHVDRHFHVRRCKSR